MSNENIFYRMEIYILSNENIFLSNENNFYRMQIYFYRMKIIFIEFCYISATIYNLYKLLLYTIKTEEPLILECPHYHRVVTLISSSLFLLVLKIVFFHHLPKEKAQSSAFFLSLLCKIAFFICHRSVTTVM